MRAELVSTEEPFAIPSMVNLPDASGYGNARTPWARMHTANLTAFPRAMALLVGGAAVSAPLLLWAPPQPALITATVATMSRAESSGSDLLIPCHSTRNFTPPVWADCCCRRVSGFRYADETHRLARSKSVRVDRRALAAREQRG